MVYQPIISEVIVVEGKHDSIAVKTAVNADTIVVFGLSVSRHIDKIKKMHEEKGVIVFTDSDRNGEKIRWYIDKYVHDVKHAYLCRMDAIGENGRIGVQYASENAIMRALQSAKATFL